MAAGVLAGSAACALALVASVPLGAQPYPGKPIRLVVPFPAGGGVDVTARIVTQRMLEPLGQQFVFDNRTGAGGSIGTDLVAKSTPDGYTLLYTLDSPVTVSAHITAKLPYDPLKDLAPVVLVASSPLVVVVHPTIGPATLADLIAAARAKPGSVNMGTAGAGTPNHLAGELLNHMSRTKMTQIHYKGSPQAVADVVSGQTQASAPSVAAALPMIRAGRVRPLAVTSARRNAAIPEVPTVAESGLAGYEVVFWVGVLAPSRTPQAVLDRLSAEFRRAIAHPEVRDGLGKQGMDPVGNTMAEFREVVRRDFAKWGEVVAAAGIQAK